MKISDAQYEALMNGEWFDPTNKNYWSGLIFNLMPIAIIFFGFLILLIIN